MITPRSALKFDLFADASRKRKLDTNGDPLQVIAEHIDFAHLGKLRKTHESRRGSCPAAVDLILTQLLR